MEPLHADLLRLVSWEEGRLGGKTESIWFRHIIKLTSMYPDRIEKREDL